MLGQTVLLRCMLGTTRHTTMCSYLLMSTDTRLERHTHMQEDRSQVLQLCNSVRSGSVLKEGPCYGCLNGPCGIDFQLLPIVCSNASRKPRPAGLYPRITLRKDILDAYHKVIVGLVREMVENIHTSHVHFSCSLSSRADT